MAYKLIFAFHATQRMLQRKISVDDVKYVIEHGEVIEPYPDDTPFPSRLLLGKIGSRALHVVAADNHQAQETVIITAYEPNILLWDADFRRRKS